MKTKSLGFIGGGRITKILLQAFQNKNAKFSRIVVTDTNNEVSANLRKGYPYVRFENASVAAGQEIVFISLHPPVIMDTLELLKNDFKRSATVISLAPKINLMKISSKLSQVKNIARLIPNATSYINEGFNPVCFSADFAKNEKKEILEVLGLLGKTFEVAEEKLENYAIMSAMLPTYFWFQWTELEILGTRFGLSETESKECIYETMNAALNTMYHSGMKPEEVMNMIPVKPIGENEDQIRSIYQEKLTALFEKIKP